LRGECGIAVGAVVLIDVIRAAEVIGYGADRAVWSYGDVCREMEACCIPGSIYRSVLIAPPSLR
tara:strand:- start:29198 stop:29389 length:192 start_codon:yes stop_codon:yes gene_type:complete